jgi:hypothetical protein
VLWLPQQHADSCCDAMAFTRLCSCCASLLLNCTLEWYDEQTDALSNLVDSLESLESESILSRAKGSKGTPTRICNASAPILRPYL